MYVINTGTIHHMYNKSVLMNEYKKNINISNMILLIFSFYIMLVD
jgi:hypothetical protein